MKIRALLSCAAACALMAFSADAAGNIATVNIQDIMQKSTAAQSVKEQLEAKQKSFQGEMSKKESQFNADEQELRKKRSVMSAEAFEKAVKAFKAKETSAQKDVQAKRAELDDAFSSSISQIQKAVFDIVADMAKEKGFIAVMPTSQMLWADPSLDITTDVLTKLNANLPKVTVNFKEVKPAEKAAEKAE